MATPAPRIMTVKEVADDLGVMPATVRKWLRDGKLQGRKASDGWLTTNQAVERFLEQAEGSESQKHHRNQHEKGVQLGVSKSLPEDDAYSLMPQEAINLKLWSQARLLSRRNGGKSATFWQRR